MRQTDKGAIRTSIQGQDFRFSESWIANSIDVLEIWKQFQEVIRVLLRSKNRKSDGKARIFNKIKGIYEPITLDEFVRDELIETFKEIWPHTFDVLQECVADSFENLKNFYDKTPNEFDEYENNLRRRLDQIKKIRNKSTESEN